MTRHSKVFVPVSVSVRLPDKEDRYSVIVDGVQESAYFNGKQFEFAVYMEKYITHWLEEKENVYVLTEQEFLDLKRKSEKLDKLGQLIEKCYVDENGEEVQDENIDLVTIGEIAATAFGWL